MKKIILKILTLYAHLKRNRFYHALRTIEETQLNLMLDVVRYYKKTQYGKELGISKVNDYQQFSNLPTTKYEDIEEKLNKDKHHFTRRILKDKPKTWEVTSGSSGKQKNIPYTKHQLKSFSDAIFIWFSDLRKNGPSFSSGKTFFSLSPKSKKLVHNSYQDDSEYLPWAIRTIFKDQLINPKNLNKIKNDHTYKLILSLSILEADDLEIFFIWSPTYLLMLLGFIEENSSEIYKIAKSNKLEAEGLTYYFDFSIEKAKMLNSNLVFSKIWPNLKFISCWADGTSSVFIEQIQNIFPKAYIQPKGLIATEGIMTIPLENPKGNFPLINHNFYEFISHTGEILPLWKIKEGMIYKILLSNKSGLLRYEIGDFVKVRSIINNMPDLYFSNRDNVVDITGEKLNEMAIQSILKKATSQGETSFIFPVITGCSVHYECISDSQNPHLEEDLEMELSNLLHYQESRRNGQLLKIKTYRVKSVINIYNNYFLKKGMVLGDIKFNCLLKEFNWSKNERIK